MRLLPLLLLAACGPQRLDPSDLVCGADEGVIGVETSDGLVLEADLRPADQAERGAFVLLHMIPPSNDRAGYPLAVREELAAGGWAVLNLDRRGAGGSDGDASDAYEGEGGRLDVEAAVRVLQGAACPVDLSRLVLVGASNGTTSVLDYTALHDASLPDPAAAVWMSPGSYTENQVVIDEHRDLLDALPMLWLHPAAEDWVDGRAASASPAWRLAAVGRDEHGTRAFGDDALRTAILDAIAELVAGL